MANATRSDAGRTKAVMAYNARVYEVMIASPSDVDKERRLISEAIHGWNYVHSKDRGIVLMPVAWHTHSSPAMGAPAQEIINKQVLKDADLVIAVFWTRLGTPTGSFPSGTVEEIEEHIGAGKPAMIYFSSQPVTPESIDPAQFQALIDFKKKCKDRGLIEEYETVDEFQEKLGRQLAQTVIRNFPRGESEDGSIQVLDQLPERQTIAPETENHRKARRIVNEMKNKIITLRWLNDSSHVAMLGRVKGEAEMIVINCDEDFVSLDNIASNAKQSLPLEKILIGFDDERNRPALEVKP